MCGIELCKAELHLNTRIEAKTTIREVIELAHMLEDEYLLELLYAVSRSSDASVEPSPTSHEVHGT